MPIIKVMRVEILNLFTIDFLVEALSQQTADGRRSGNAFRLAIKYDSLTDSSSLLHVTDSLKAKGDAGFKLHP